MAEEPVVVQGAEEEEEEEEENEKIGSSSSKKKKTEPAAPGDRREAPQWYYFTAAAVGQPSPRPTSQTQPSAEQPQNDKASTPAVRGPLTKASFLKLVERGVIRADRTMVFQRSASSKQDATTTWTPATEADGLKDSVGLACYRWFYCDTQNAVVGPVNVAELRRRLDSGDIDGVTRVYHDDQWRAVAEVPGLRELLVGGDEDNEVSFEALVERERREEALKKQETTRKSFVADDGRAFEWDARAATWVEADHEAVADSEAHEAKVIEDDDDEEASLLIIANNTTTSAAAAAEKKKNHNNTKEQPKKKKKRQRKGSGWDPTAGRCWIYVQGVPTDATTQELAAHFSKCGVLATDPETLGPRIKLYRDAETNELKGDAAICYAKEASVALALQVLDGGSLRYGATLKVTKADFNEQRLGAYDSSKKRKVHAMKRRVAKQASKQVTDWAYDDDADRLDDEGNTTVRASKKSKQLRIIVVKHAFDGPARLSREEAERSVLKILEEGELQKPPDKITVVEGHDENVALVKLHSAPDATAALDLFNNYASSKSTTTTDKRKNTMSAHFWDGVTNYADEVRSQRKAALEEEDDDDDDDDDDQARLEHFGDWLEDQDLPPELQPNVER